MAKPNDLKEILSQALFVEVGLEIATTDTKRLRQAFYRTRRKYPELFSNLAFVISPNEPETKLWIVKRPEDTDAEA